MRAIKPKQLELIVAATPAGEIGYKNTIPWHLKGDLSRFRQITMGEVVLMGVRTYESLPKKLDGRSVIVLTRTAEGARLATHSAFTRDEEIRICSSLQHAISIANQQEGPATRLIVAGGAALYEETLREHHPIVHLTTVYKRTACPYYDTRIEGFDMRGFEVFGHPTPVYEVNPATGVTEVSHIYSTYHPKVR